MAGSSRGDCFLLNGINCRLQHLGYEDAREYTFNTLNWWSIGTLLLALDDYK